LAAWPLGMVLLHPIQNNANAKVAPIGAQDRRLLPSAVAPRPSNAASSHADHGHLKTVSLSGAPGGSRRWGRGPNRAGASVVMVTVAVDAAVPLGVTEDGETLQEP